MSRNLMILFLVVAVVCATVMSHPPPKDDDCEVVTKPPPTKKPVPRCGKNEVWTNCGAPLKCQPTCAKRNPICPKICVKGCVCQKGLLRNSKGKCVQPCDCDC